MSWREERIGDARLICADCRDVLPTLSGIDAVVTDPPYNYGKEYGTHNDAMPWEDFAEWLECRMRLACNALRDGGVCYFTCSTQMMAMCEAWPFVRFRQWLIWHRPNLVNIHAHSDWKQTWEPIYYGGRGKFAALRGILPDSAVFTIATPQSNFIDGRQHVAQRPVGLLIGILRRVDASMVVDPFMGSGTTGVACARLRRKFIGIEIHEPYFDIACRRIEEAYRQRDLFVPPPQHPVETEIADMFQESAE